MFLTLPNTFGDACTNMAIDVALLESLPAGSAVFRHYGWTQPSITFGYSQQHREVAAHAPAGVTLCRRITGGGIVDHRNDWTYALAVQRAVPGARLASPELYTKLHTALATALAVQTIESQLAPCPKACGEPPAKSAGPDQCFVQPVMSDVLNPSGQKIAGAAMKRTRQGLLIQGSLDRAALPVNFDAPAFATAFTTALARALELKPQQPDNLGHLFDRQLIEAHKQRFAGEAWTTRR